MSDLGELVRWHRERLGLSQEELAALVQPAVSVNTISNVERGRTRPYRHTLEGLGTALNLGQLERAALLGAWRPRSAPPGATVCAMAIEGAAAFWEAGPGAMAGIRGRVELLLAEAIAETGGSAIGTPRDDQILVSRFSTADAAAQCVVRLREALAQEPWTTGIVPQVRIALHTGDPEPEDAINGPTLDRARALLTFAAGGGTVVSGVTADLLAIGTPPGVHLDHLGEWALAETAQTEEVFRFDLRLRGRAGDAAGDLSAEDLETLGEQALWEAHPHQSIAARQRAHATYLERGDRRGAARMALGLVVNHIIRLSPSVAAGWFNKARRLLEGEPESPEHGWLAFTTSLIQIATGQFEAAVESARTAYEVGRRFDDSDLQALGLVFQGFALLSLGRVDAGVSLMDEAMAYATAGELRPLARGLVYCRTISACLDRFDYRRALEWTMAIDECGNRPGVSAYPGDCRTHRAAVLIIRGDWAQGEQEARAACAETATFDLTHAGLATYQIGEILLRRGDLAGAETAFRRAHELGANPQPGFALLRLAQGDTVGASVSIGQALSEKPNDLLARAKLLPAQVEIAVAGESADNARGFAAELAQLADTFDSSALRAAAACAQGAVQLVDGDPGAAVRSLRRGCQLWREEENPYEAARARVVLARALAALGDHDACTLELDSARQAFERLGAEPDARSAVQLANQFRS